MNVSDVVNEGTNELLEKKKQKDSLLQIKDSVALSILAKAKNHDLMLSEALKQSKRTNETDFKSLASKALKNTTEAS